MRTILVTLAFAAAMAGLAACSGGEGGGFGGKRDGRYLTEEVAVGAIEKTVLGSGVLQPFEVVNVGAQASGRIETLAVELGDVVRRGQVLATIDPSDQQNALRDAEARLIDARARKASNEANLVRNELALKRQEQLVERGFASRADYERADADLKVSRANVASIDAQIRQAEVAVQRARVDLSRTNITAPIDGVVAAIVVRAGQTVNAIQTAPTIVRLAKLDIMTVKAQISEADVVHVTPGQKAYFTVLGDPDRRYEAVLRGVEPAPENAGENLTGQPNQPVYYNALFDVPNPDGRLKPAMTAQVTVVVGGARGVLTMPSAGLGERLPDGRYKVKVLNADGRTTDDRTVRIGVNDNVHAQVLEGLKAGEKVVVADSMDSSISGTPQPKNKAKDKEKAKAQPKEKQTSGGGGVSVSVGG
jgi:macrolide-specific efflux system membrane fusion protein